MDTITEIFCNLVETVGSGFRSMAKVASREDPYRAKHEGRRKLLHQIFPLVEGLSVHEVMFIL